MEDHHKEYSYGFGRMCSCGCRRPARELGGYSTYCWMNLTPMQRKVLQEDAGREHGDTIAVKPIAYVDPALFTTTAKEIAGLPAYLGPRRFVL